MSREYRIIETIGPYWNRRYELQEKYNYYDNGELKTAWHMVMHSKSKEVVELALSHKKKLQGEDNYEQNKAANEQS